MLNVKILALFQKEADGRLAGTYHGESHSTQHIRKQCMILGRLCLATHCVLIESLQSDISIRENDKT